MGLKTKAQDKMLLTVVSQKDTLSSFPLAQEVSSWLTPNFAHFTGAEKEKLWLKNKK